MSGFEVLGVVFGTIPLVISALEHYEAGKGVLASVVEYPDLLRTLIRRIKLQKTFFFIEIRNLLRDARIHNVVDRIDVTEEECLRILKNRRNDSTLKEYLGYLHMPFLEVLDQYKECLQRVAAKLSHIRRPSNAVENDLVAIFNENPPENGSFAFTERINFAISRESLAELVKDFGEDRLSLKTIVEQASKEQTYIARQPSHNSERLARVFKQVQVHATPLFEAMCTAYTCDCLTKHQVTHNVLMRLQNCMPLDTGVSGLINRTEEQAVYSLAIGLGNFWQETSARVSHAGQSDCRGASNQVATTPVTNICEHADEARKSSHVLELQLTGNTFHQFGISQEKSLVFSAPKTLKKFLQNGIQVPEKQMDRKQRLLLALNIAVSIPQLQQTCWFDFLFNNGGLVILEQEPRTPSAPRFWPAVERVMEKDWAGWADISKGPNPNEAVLELAILLLQIWYHEPVVMPMAEADRMMAAHKWFQGIADDLPPDYRKAVGGCLALWVGVRHFWNDEFFESYCENVVAPLRRTCESWTLV